MFKVLHMPSATYVKWYPNTDNHKVEDITFNSWHDAEGWIFLFTCIKSIAGDYYVMQDKPLTDIAKANLKEQGRYVLTEHLTPIEVLQCMPSST